MNTSASWPWNKVLTDTVICVHFVPEGDRMSANQPRRATDHGMSRSSFYRQAHAGNYEKIGRGLYLPADADAADWDWLEAASRHARSTICLTSALAHYDLID